MNFKFSSLKIFNLSDWINILFVIKENSQSMIMIRNSTHLSSLKNECSIFLMLSMTSTCVLWRTFDFSVEGTVINAWEKSMTRVAWKNLKWLNLKTKSFWQKRVGTWFSSQNGLCWRNYSLSMEWIFWRSTCHAYR